MIDIATTVIAPLSRLGAGVYNERRFYLHRFVVSIDSTLTESPTR